MRLAHKAIVFSALASGVALAAPAAEAGAFKAQRSANFDGHAHVITVSHDRAWRRRNWHRHNGDTVVDAPFTYVETGYHRRVAVDAPFTAVRVGRRGVWVRAPFVNLFVPR